MNGAKSSVYKEFPMTIHFKKKEIVHHPYLKHTHAICISKYLVGFSIITIANICSGYKQLKWVILLQI